jgi:hypothetical protein
MKSKLLLAAFLIFVFAKANAQLLQLGNKWIFDKKQFIGGGLYTEKIDSIVVVADTIINGRSYFKLVTAKDHPCGVFSKEEYLREEKDKIYRLRKNSTIEDLLIDYTTQNSYNMTFVFPFSDKQILATVINDSIANETLPNGKKLQLKYQRIKNNSSTQDNTIYKLSREIGYIHSSGILFPNIGTGLCDPIEFTSLRCKISNLDTINLTNLGCYQSSIITSTTDIDEAQILFYPNPTQDIVKFDGDYEVLSIFNLSGTKMNYVQNTDHIDISQLPPGTYFITIEQGAKEKVNTYKIIKL